jgi:predicted esterase
MPRDTATDADRAGSAQGRLLTRPTPPTERGSPGLHALGLATGRDVLLYVPASYRPDQPAPLVVSLHGANGAEQRGLNLLQSFADAAGLLVLAPASRGRTWDIILGSYGPDVAFVDRALAWTFARYAVDPARVTISGFSDGASYALSLGLSIGDLYVRIVAFSPGFVMPAARRGGPRVYVSHGTLDTVLPIDRCSRRIVPMLRLGGYDVRYDEFEGGHTVPPEIARAAVDWLQTG